MFDIEKPIAIETEQTVINRIAKIIDDSHSSAELDVQEPLNDLLLTADVLCLNLQALPKASRSGER